MANETIKIKSTDPESQGDFVVIEKADFDVTVHEEYDENAPAAPAKLTVPQIKSKLDELGIEYPSNAKRDDLIALLPAA